MAGLIASQRFKRFHILFWIVAGVGLFISGYSQSDATVSATRNIYLMLVGAVTTYLLLKFWPKIPHEKARASWLLFLVACYAPGTLLVLPINPVTFSQLGLDFANFTQRHLLAGSMNYSMVLAFWGVFVIFLFPMGFKLPGALGRGQTPLPAKSLGGLEVEVKGGSEVIPLADINHLKAASDYVEVVLNDGRVLLKRATIQSLAKSLGDKGFVQVHRSIIINVSALEATEAASKGTYTLVMKAGVRLKSSRGFKAAVERLLP